MHRTGVAGTLRSRKGGGRCRCVAMRVPAAAGGKGRLAKVLLGVSLELRQAASAAEGNTLALVLEHVTGGGWIDLHPANRIGRRRDAAVRFVFH